MPPHFIRDGKIVKKHPVSRLRHDGKTKKPIILFQGKDLHQPCPLPGNDHGERFLLAGGKCGLIEGMDLIKAFP